MLGSISRGALGEKDVAFLASLGGMILYLLLGDSLVSSYEVVTSTFRAGSCSALGAVALTAKFRALEAGSPECGNGIEEHR